MGASVTQAKARQTRVQLVAEIVHGTELNTTSAKIARDAVLSAYGATQSNLQQAQGQDTPSPTILQLWCL